MEEHQSKKSITFRLYHIAVLCDSQIGPTRKVTVTLATKDNIVNKFTVTNSSIMLGIVIFVEDYILSKMGPSGIWKNAPN